MNAVGTTPAKLSAIADLMETLVVPDGTDEAPEDGLLQIGTVVKFIAWNPLMIGTIVAYNDNQGGFYSKDIYPYLIKRQDGYQDVYGKEQVVKYKGKVN